MEVDLNWEVILRLQENKFVCDRTRLDQVDHPIWEHLAVHSQSLVALQILHHCIRNHTDASLQSRSIFHQIVCNQLPDLVLHLILLCTSHHTTKHTWKDVLRNGTIHVTTLSRWLMCTKLSPEQRGIWELISATTTSAHSAAARVASILAPNVQNPCLLHYEHTWSYLTISWHPMFTFTSAASKLSSKRSTVSIAQEDQVQSHRIAVFSCPSLEGSRDELPALSENPLLCPSALLLTPLRHLGHILDSVLKRISAFVRISNTLSANDKQYLQFLQFCVDTRNICLDGARELINFCGFVVKETFLPYN